jgi:hypothetical protein
MERSLACASGWCQLWPPGHPSLGRRPIRRNAAEWEFRFGPDNRFRILYEIQEAEHEVHVLAIGEKEGNRLFIGGEDIGL